MDFPILDLMDQDGCYHKLLDLLHPDGLVCPRCAARDGLNVHRHRPESAVVDYRCQGCCRVFNLFTGTPWQGTHLSPSQILLIVRGMAQGVPTAKLAREVEVSRQHLLRLRHTIQARALATADRSPLPDDQAEADEMYQNAGEKRGATHRPGRPATATGEQGQRPRHLSDRPAAGARSGGSTGRSAVGPRRAAKRGGGVGRRHGPAGYQAGGDGVHRRVERVQAAGALWPRPRDSQP